MVVCLSGGVGVPCRGVCDTGVVWHRLERQQSLQLALFCNLFLSVHWVICLLPCLPEEVYNQMTGIPTINTLCLFPSATICPFPSASTNQSIICPPPLPASSSNAAYSVCLEDLAFVLTNQLLSQSAICLLSLLAWRGRSHCISCFCAS